MEQLPKDGVTLMYVTPSHQYPLGFTLPIERRLKLLDWARRCGAYIIEDDYDSDFRYRGSPLTALMGLDDYGCVMYLGTFSKSMGAGLRLGYLVVPKALVPAARSAKALLNNGHAWLDQATMAEFIRSGAYGNHLRRMRNIYSKRHDCLIDALREHFGAGTTFWTGKRITSCMASACQLSGCIRAPGACTAARGRNLLDRFWNNL